MKHIFFVGLMAVSTLMANIGGSKSINYSPSVHPTVLSSVNAGSANDQAVVMGTSGDSIEVYFDNLEGDVSGWTFNGQWSLTTSDSYSPSHSFVADDDPTGAGVSELISPVISLPTVNNIEALTFEFALFCDLPDSDGDSDGLLEDYYQLKVADVATIPWHRSSFGALDSDISWWCGSEDLGGYSNSWLQFLDTDPITLPAASASLDFKLKYALEAVVSPQDIDGCTIDGWDVANIRISTDGGVNWSTLTGSPSYNVSSGFGWSYNNDGCNVAGWGGLSGGWKDASFDLSAYVNQEVIIRFAFGADGGFSTADDASLTGLFVDNILVSTLTDTLFYNDAASDLGMVVAGMLWTDLFYDYNNPEQPRPGSTDWTVYQEGMQFNGGMDLTDFAGKDIRILWQSRVDDNTDGGDGTGFHIDDLNLYKTVNVTLPVPDNVSVLAGAGEVQLEWNNLNDPQTVSFAYSDGGFTSFYSGSLPWTSGQVIGSGWASRYETFFPTTLTSFSYMLSEGNLSTPGTIKPIKVTVWDADNQIIFQSPTITPSAMGSLLEYDLSSENIVVNNSFYVGWTHTNILAPFVALNAGASTGEAYGWHPEGTMLSLAGTGLDGNYALLAEGTTSPDGGFTYNIYRRTATEEFTTPINAVPLSSASFTDNTVMSGVEYYYAVTSLYKGEESELSPEMFAYPESPTVYTIAYDDGLVNTGFNLGANNYLAVKFTPQDYPAMIQRFSLYNNDVVSGSVIGVIWDDDGAGGLPQTELLRFDWNDVLPGWNTSQLAADSIWINEGSFYMGIQEVDPVISIGVDTDVYSGNSYYALDGEMVWDNISGLGVDYNVMIRAAMHDELAHTAIDEFDGEQVPDEYVLNQNYPNPFNPSTEISYFLPEAGYVELKVYDLNGREMEALVQKHQTAGSYRLQLDGSDLTSGIYIYNLRAGNTQLTRKMILLK